MHVIIYYKINGHERYDMQHVSMDPVINGTERFAIATIAEWHLMNHSLVKYTKIPAVIEDCGWEYPGKENRYVVMEQHTYEGKWSEYMSVKTRFLTLENAKKVLKDTKNWKPLMPGPYRFKIKEYSSKRYPNIITDHKFTQEQVEQKMHEMFKTLK